MQIEEHLLPYLKDSLVNGKICRFNRESVFVFITKISENIPEYKKQEYYEIIRRTTEIWNKYAPVKFVVTENQNQADIVIIWVKTGIKFEGMCKFRSIVASEIKAVTIEIGLPNPNSPKIINSQTILHTALHELGHAMGLGHGINENDVMFVPHKKTLSEPSQNDIQILNIIYSFSAGSVLSEITQ